MPRSRALRISSTACSSVYSPHQPVLSVQRPNPTSETLMFVFGKTRYFINPSLGWRTCNECDRVTTANRPAFRGDDRSAGTQGAGDCPVGRAASDAGRPLECLQSPETGHGPVFSVRRRPPGGADGGANCGGGLAEGKNQGRVGSQDDGFFFKGSSTGVSEDGSRSSAGGFFRAGLSSGRWLGRAETSARVTP